MDKDVVEIFKTRDQAVAQKQPASFLATELDEGTPNSSLAGYFSVSSLLTEVLHVHRDQHGSLSKVFVKESYTDREQTRTAFLIYSLVKTSGGWKIYRVSG